MQSQLLNLRFDLGLPTADNFWNLFRTTGWNDEYRLSKGALHAAITNSWYMISVYHDERLVGFGRVVSDCIVHAIIYDLVVDPGFQNQGIGSEILERLVIQCKRAGIRDIQLFSAHGKRVFYERCGFRVRPEDSPGMEFAGKILCLESVLWL